MTLEQVNKRLLEHTFGTSENCKDLARVANANGDLHAVGLIFTQFRFLCNELRDSKISGVSKSKMLEIIKEHYKTRIKTSRVLEETKTRFLQVLYEYYQIDVNIYRPKQVEEVPMHNRKSLRNK